MKSDINATKATNLEEFYNTFVQEVGEGLYHHPNLKKYADQCTTIKELGVLQGMSLALCMLSENTKAVHGVDINGARIEPYLPLFQKYAEEKNIDFNFIEKSSTDWSTAQGKFEMLHIDSMHVPSHLEKELQLHAPNITKYIVFHDTANFKHSKGLFPVIARYITEVDQNWVIVEHNNYRVGYTVIARRDTKLPPYAEK